MCVFALQLYHCGHTCKLCDPHSPTYGRTCNYVDLTSPPCIMFYSATFCVYTLELELTPAAIYCIKWLDHVVAVIYQMGGVTLLRPRQKYLTTRLSNSYI